MATSVYFNGKMRTLPGVYSTITSGDNTQTRTLDYGTVLFINTGTELFKGYGGGSGSNGKNLAGKDAVYEFYDLQTFRDFVKGGMAWKAAEALFTPDPYNADAVGISKLLYVRAAETTPAVMTFATAGGSQFVIETIDEGDWSNGVIENIGGVNYLKTGYCFTIEQIDEPEEAPTAPAFKFKIWRGAYTGDYKDPVTKVTLSYDEMTVEQADPILICESPEVNTVKELIEWANSDLNFGARFILGDASKFVDEAQIATSDVTAYADFATAGCATGGTEDFKSTDLTKLMNEISDVDYNIVMTDRVGENVFKNGAPDAELKQIIEHRNTQAKFDKFLYVGAFDQKLEFQKSLDLAKGMNNAYIVAIHGGVATASNAVASGFRWWGVFYNLCQLVGRVSGKPPYIPVTNKTMGGDKLQHIPSEKEQERALKAGLCVVAPNPYLQRFVVVQGVTTLQDNTILFTKKGHSFSIQFMRIIAQLNKECVVNASIDLLGDENGVNMNTLSKGSLETWTINFLQTRVATMQQDNLINRFQKVVAKRVDDCYHVSYEVVLNNEITKIFFTGFLLRN